MWRIFFTGFRLLFDTSGGGFEVFLWVIAALMGAVGAVLLIGWIAFAYYSQGGSPAAVGGVLFILLLFACVVLHEFGHALAGKAFGINTPDITLLPIGGVASMSNVATASLFVETGSAGGAAKPENGRATARERGSASIHPRLTAERRKGPFIRAQH